MKALITGSAGFAGSHLAEYLLEQGQEVVALVRSEDRLRNLEHLLSRIQVTRGDVLDLHRISAVLQETRPQRVYHLAALSSAAASFDNPPLTYNVNFTGTFNLLWAWRQTQLDSRFLLVSSSEVYGQVSERNLPVREDAPLRPPSPYAGSKAAAELLGLQFFESYGLPIVRVRPFNHTGPRQSSSYVCSSLARQVVEIELGLRAPLIAVGNLNARRDFSDVRDIVRGYHLLLERGQPGDVYQLCSGRPVSIENVLQSLLRSLSKAVKVTEDESKLRVRDVPAMWGDPSKAARAASWKPCYQLQSTLHDLTQYWEDSIQAERAGISTQAAPPELPSR